MASTRSTVAVSKIDGLEAGQRAGGHGHTFGRGQPLDLGRQGPLGLPQDAVVGVAEIDRQHGPVGHDVHEVGGDLEAPDGGDLGAAELLGQPAGVRGDGGGDVAGVAPQPHRRGAGVGRPADDRQLGPRDALHALDDADGDPLVLEDGPLLDVQLDVGVGHGRRRARHRAGVADALELVAEPGAVVDGTDVEGVLDRHAADVDEAAEHVGREAGALLVGEDADGDRAAGADVVLDQRLEHLQAGEHAEVAVEASAGGDGVDVRAGHHRRRRRVRARPGGDDVADVVDGDGQAEVVHPADDEVAAVAVGVGEGQAGAPLLAVGPLDRPDLAQFDQPPPQPLAVHAQ